MARTARHAAKGTIRLEADRGNVLIPCLFILSLISLMTLGILNIGGIGSSVSDTLADRSQVRLAAISGIEVAYERLAMNRDYTGEKLAPFADSSCQVAVSVKPLGSSRYDVFSRANLHEIESIIRTRVETRPWVTEYPLSVGGSVRMYGDARILGDTYVSSVVTGKPHTQFLGDMYLKDTRDILYDLDGNPVSIDGFPIPTITGAISTCTEAVTFPKVDLEKLKAIAVAQGQYYDKTMHFEDVDMKGVLFFQNDIARPFFKNVTLRGVLVCDKVSEIRVEAGFFKIRADDALCPNVAILAPTSNLWVDPFGKLDVYGLSYLYETDFQGKATFTGPVLSQGDLYARPDSFLYFQFPSEMKNFNSDFFEWSDIRVVELEFEEL
jgi:hypothetical protein